MGFLDPETIMNIVRLTQSPKVQYVGNQLGAALNNYTGRPLQAPNVTGRENNTIGGQGTHRMRGASPVAPQGRQQMGDAPVADPLMQLYSQLLEQLQSPVQQPTGIDTDNLMKQVQSAINPIYDQRSQAAQAQTKRATGQVKNMYGALADDYERLAPQQAAQAAEAQKQVEQLYGQLRSNIQGDYARVSEEQAELFKSLGIQDALPDVLADQQAPVQDALTAASQNQAQQSQRYTDIGQMDQTYYREGSPAATMTGNEISTDMLQQLGDYLNQIEAERTSGIQSGYLDQLGQAQTQLGQQQQAAQGETARRQEMLWQMLQGQLQGKQQPLNADSFMSGLPPEVQQQVGGAYTQLQRSPEAVYGKTEDPRNPVPGTYVETTPQWYAAQADKMLQAGQIDQTTYQALLMYLQLMQK